jgi:hypothetical protein
VLRQHEFVSCRFAGCCERLAGLSLRQQAHLLVAVPSFQIASGWENLFLENEDLFRQSCGWLFLWT